MKLIIVPALAAIVSTSFADQARDVSDSKQGSWNLFSADRGQILVQSVSQESGASIAHWNVVVAATGESLWSGKPDLGFVPRKNEVFLAPGGMHVGVVNRYLYFRGKPEDLVKQRIMWVFHRSDMLMQYTLEGLGVTTNDIIRSVSHIHAFPDGFDFLTPELPADRGLLSKTAPTKLFGGDASSLMVTFRCGIRVTLDFEKKEIRSSERLISEDEYRKLGDLWHKL